MAPSSIQEFTPDGQYAPCSPLSNVLILIFQRPRKDFPGGTVVKNLPANAGDTGFEPWSGKIPHAAEQLGP